MWVWMCTCSCIYVCGLDERKVQINAKQEKKLNFHELPRNETDLYRSIQKVWKQIDGSIFFFFQTEKNLFLYFWTYLHKAWAKSRNDSCWTMATLVALNFDKNTVKPTWLFFSHSPFFLCCCCVVLNVWDAASFLWFCPSFVIYMQ